MYYKREIEWYNDNNLKLTYYSIYTYMETKEKSDNDKWVCFKNTQNAMD